MVIMKMYRCSFHNRRVEILILPFLSGLFVFVTRRPDFFVPQIRVCLKIDHCFLSSHDQIFRMFRQMVKQIHIPNDRLMPFLFNRSHFL